MTDEKPKGLAGRLKAAAATFVEQRRHARHYGTRQLKLKIEGYTHHTVDWSVGGFGLAGFHREIARGQDIEGEIIGGIARVKDRRFTARVVRAPPDGKLGVQFTEIGTEAFQALNEAQEV